MITVLIVDDHDIVREGVRQMVSETTDIVVGSEARTGAEAIEQVRARRWDAVILDLNLPDRPGLDVLAQIRALAPDLPVLILSMQEQPSYAARALKGGALGYVGKNNARAHLVNAIRRVARGERFLPPELAESLVFDLMQPPRAATHESLSDREFQVLCAIAGGKPPREIAAELNVSVKTVATHRARLLVKMGFRNNAEVVQYALENDLLPRRA
ncbi:MAG TPA: response regulator transcription factor [Thermoanaerobaculia bacterium]|nr:response regulator transcription factor [Thermoanaerobaculia bacterium]